MPGERIILLGVNHKTTPVHVREKMAITDGYEKPLLRLKSIPGCRECYLLATCNRVELLLVADSAADLENEVLDYLFGSTLPREKCREYLYIYYDNEAAHHLFMVAASLDSMIVGEAQILGQIKDAYRNAAGLNCTGALLNKLLHKSFSVAKRVRSETGIGSSAVSISYAAVQLARKIFGSLKEKKVLLVGAGEMAELAAEHLVGQGVTGVVVANRTLSRAVDLAKKFNGQAVSLSELTSQLESVDIIISSTGASDIILYKDDVKSVMRVRRNRPLFFIDIAVPRDLDPQLIDLENVFLYDIDDLSSVVEMNKSQRDKEAVKARRIVDEEAVKFARWREGMAITPTIRAMRNKIEQICNEELERTCGKMENLSAAERRQLEKMSKAIASKVLHDPLQYLKNNDCERSNEKKVYNLRNIFKLEDGNDEKP
ncbi:MAG: glutamyl-tRNA reductase [Desulfopila sp.]|jgi:glutamyl-tRNA reductase|nr:glutamyl-tRNA reductase [Desulfopila sp.]